MITEERLKELIESKSDIYVIQSIKNTKLKLNENCCIDEKEKMLAYVPNEDDGELVWGGVWYIHFSEIYETEEEANWGRKFKRIPRVGYLDLPSWEEINERLKNESYIDIPFYDPQYNRHSIWISPAQVCVCDYWDDGSYGGTDEEFNKENYIKACEMAKRLFLGKEENQWQQKN